MTMNDTSQFPISDELLSAYIDGEATDAEKQQIEYAIANDPEIAWQVETLRRTITLLRDLPMIPAPRSFALEEAQVADILAARRQQRTASGRSDQSTSSIWRQVLAFFASGNLALRNAAAIASALFVVVTLSRAYIAQGPMFPNPAPSAQTAMLEVASEAADSAAVERSEPDSAAMALPEPADRGERGLETADATGAASIALRSAPAAGTAAVDVYAYETQPAEYAAESARSLPAGDDATGMATLEPEMGSFSITASEEAATENSVMAAAEPTTESEEPPTMAMSTGPVEEEAPMAADVAEDGVADAESADMTTMMAAITAEEPGSTVASDEEAAANTAVLQTEDAAISMKASAEVADEAPTAEAVPEATQFSATEPAPTEPSEVALQVERAEGDGEAAKPRIVPAETATPVAPAGGAAWSLWQTMQVGLLSLSLILLVLWLGSRRRV